MLVLYGSQTGTAQDVAESFAFSLLGSHVTCRCFALDEYDIKDLINESMVVFVCSTTGQGEPPDNMMRFWRFIMRKRLPNDSLSGIKFAVLGLGDSSYAKYNFVGKKLNRRLLQLGAWEMLPLYLADDQHEFGVDITVDKWYSDMWKEIIKIYPAPNNKDLDMNGQIHKSRFSVQPSSLSLEDYGKTLCSEFSYVKVIKNTRVTSVDHFQDTRLIGFDTSTVHESVHYLPGDVAMILPCNSKENVDQFLDILKNIDPDQKLEFKANYDNITLPKHIPNITTLRQLATHYFDIMSVPRRSFFQILHKISDDELEEEKFGEFASVEGSDERIAYVNRSRRSILEVLQDFHKTASVLRLDQLIDAVPAMQPRAFSIASSPITHVHEIHILVAIVKYKTNLKNPRKGLCSTWLSHLNSGDIVPLKIKRGGIVFPNDITSNPVIMVGPGTGVSPFRSAIHEYSSKVPNTKNIILFFGCRNRAKDYYFKAEWDKLSLNVYTAFSRDQDNKIYVQDKIKENGGYLWEFINDKSASIFIAGNSKNMPDGVKRSFLTIFKEHGRMNEVESEDYLENLQKKKRYQQETWS